MNNKKQEEDQKPVTLKIRKFGDPILRKKTKSITQITPEIVKLINDMIATMYSAKGVGLAANQVGKNFSLAVVDVSLKDEPQLIILINPRILSKKSKVLDDEGCLSFPGINCKIRRYKKICVETLNLNFKKVLFEAEGFTARALQHEIDHLNGKCFIDYLLPWQKIKVWAFIRKKRKTGEW